MTPAGRRLIRRPWPARTSTTPPSTSRGRPTCTRKEHTVLGYPELDNLLQPTAEYRALPAKVAQWVLKQVILAWTSYFAACQEWAAHPEQFLGHPKPKLPKYLPKYSPSTSPSTSPNRGGTSSPTRPRPSAATPRTLAGSCPRASPSVWPPTYRSKSLTRCVLSRVPHITPWKSSMNGPSLPLT
jgi:hypothetical protein